jgi:hypothetical protein
MNILTLKGCTAKPEYLRVGYGKITRYMETETKKEVETPPRLFDAFISGFNTVASHIYLILFPVAIDLLLWFGPHVRIRELLLPVTNQFFGSLISTAAPDMVNVLQTSQQAWIDILGHLNLVSMLRSYPVGISSLLVSLETQINPFGPPQIFEVNSLFQLMSICLLFSLLGMVLGSFYFNQVATCCDQNKKNVSPIHFLVSQIIQVFVLSIFLLIILLLLTVPTSILLSVFALINLALAQTVLIIIIVLFLWLFLPLAFSPMGIFYYNQKALNAMLTSAKVVRTSLPTASLFIVLAILIDQGMDVIWTIPPDSSWMLLIGIAGHAFTSTALLASFFIFYRNNYQWLQDKLRRLTAHRLNV